MELAAKDEFSFRLRRRISTAYEASGNICGWRLLASPLSVLDGADVAFLGLNPGGSFQPAEHGQFAMPQASAYVVETWGGSDRPGTSPLQRQVRALFAGLSVAPERVLAGNSRAAQSHFGDNKQPLNPHWLGEGNGHESRVPGWQTHCTATFVEIQFYYEGPKR